MDFAQLSQYNSVLKSIHGAMAPYYHFELSYKDYANNKYEDVAQSSFLFSPEEQEDAFLSSGYIKGQPDDYGLVRNAVGNKSIPVYQKVEDAIDRNNLEPIANTYSFFGPTPLEHAGNYPTALYIDEDYNIYQKGWDFNNYGKDNNTSNNAHEYYSKLKQFAANTLDKLGRPVVRTTGFQKLDSAGINSLIHTMSLENPDLINNLIGKNKQFDEQYNSIVNQRIEDAYSDYINEVVLPTMFDGRGRQNTNFEEWKAAENFFPIEKFKKHISEYEKFLHNRRIIIDHGTPKLKLGYKNGGILKAQKGTGNLLTPHPLSPVGIALNQAKAMAKMKGEQQHLPPGVKEVVGPDGKKVAIRTEQPLQPLEQSIAEWLPGTGDVAEVGYIANDVKNGRYGSAALATAMIALPGNVGKILRKGDTPPVSKLSEAERLGIPKGQRSNPAALEDPQYWGYKQWNERYNAAVRAGN
jgi:hypothetical protein